MYLHKYKQPADKFIAFQVSPYDHSNIDIHILDSSEENFNCSATENTIDVGFINELKKYDLEIKKQVLGNTGNKEEKFDFEIEFYTEDKFKNRTPYNLVGSSIPIGVNKIENDRYAFSLSHSERVLFMGLPYGVKYTVTEDNYDSVGYSTSVDNVEGRGVSGQLTSSNITHIFKNERNVAVQTNIRANITYNTFLIIVLTSCIISLIIFKIKRLRR